MPLVITRKIAGIGNGTSVAINYTGLSEADTNPKSFELVEFLDRSIQVAGTFNGGSVVVEGSNNGIDWQTLTDPQGNALIFSAPRIEKIQELTAYTRPRVNSGTGVSVNAAFLVTRTAGEIDAGLLEGDLNALQSTVSALTGDVSGHNVDIANINTELDARGVQVDQAIADIQVLESAQNNDAINIGNLQSGLSTAQSNITALQTSSTTAQNNITSLQSGLTTAQSNISTLQTSVGSLTSQTSSLEAANTQNEADITALQNSLTNLDESDVAETATFKKFTSTLKTQLEGLLAAMAVGIPVQAGKVTYPLGNVITTVVSVSSASGVEGSLLVHTVTLSRPAVVGDLFTFDLQNSTTGAGDYTYPPTFSAGVTLNTGVLTIPVGVDTFTISVQTTNDSSPEPTENYTLTVGGVTGTGTITDNDTVEPLSALTKIAIYEAPYAHLTSPQKTAIEANGGYAAFAVSRDSVAQATFRVYRSATENGTYTQVLTGQSYTPSADLIGSIGYQHDTLAFENEVNWPTTFPANTIGLMQDTAGQQEFSLLDSWATYTEGGETAKVLENMRTAIYHSLPIQVESYDTARMYLLPTNIIIDPTLHAQNTTVYYKIVPADAQGNELALSSVLPIPFTVTGVANKPYPPRQVGYFSGGVPTSVGDYQQFPTTRLVRADLYIYCGNSDRLVETTPSGFFAPSSTKETGVTYQVDVIGRDDQVLRTLTADANGVATYSMGNRATDGELDPTKFNVYAIKGPIRSRELMNIVSIEHRDSPDLTSVTNVQNGTSVDITVTMEKTFVTPYALTFELSGTLVSNNHLGAITASNGVILEDSRVLQIPPGVQSFVLTVATVDAQNGETLTATFGRPEYNDVLTTTRTLTIGPAYVDILLTPNQTGLPSTQIAIDTGPPRWPSNSNLGNYTNGATAKELNVLMPANSDYLVLELTSLVTSFNTGQTFTLMFKEKIDVAVTDAYSYEYIMTEGDTNTSWSLSIQGSPDTPLSSAYGAEKGLIATNNSGVNFVAETHKLFLQIAGRPTQRATQHTYSIKDVYKA